MNLLVIILIIVLLFGGVGFYGHGAWGPNFGYGIGGLGGIVVLVLVIMLLTGRL